MKILELITERKAGKLSKRQQNSTRGLHVFSDAEKANSDYTFNRVGLAAAMCDGTNDPDVDYLSWIGKKKLTAPYTKVEADMLKQAYKLAGANHQDLNHGDMSSKELKSTNTVSPVSNWNKTK
jgi:hypothetical protein